MSVRHINKKRVIAGTAIAVPLGIIAAGAASAADAPAPLGGLSAVTNTVNSTATSTNVLHGITDLAMAKQAAPSVAAPAAPAAPAEIPAPASNPITATVVNATQGTPLAALLPQADTVGKHRTDSKAPAAPAQPAQAKHRKAKHAKDPQPLDAVTGNLGRVVDLSLVNHTVDGVTEQLGLGHTVTDALKPVTGNGGILTGLLGIKEHSAVKAQHQGRHARPAQSLVDDSALPHTGGDSAEIAMLLGAGLALTGAGARMVTRRRRQDG
ncbi:MAG TPA: LPXTG cell wall anchor domain-containing protein [Sporichthyaceae bacterium]|nr:LPXTG cell wall anchor domain-containing protein [Sporichthyaceae bacterium]